MVREIVLDTETTGIDPKTGHRVVEIACVEIEDLLPTGRSFHRYIDPERDIDPDAERVHGLSRRFLRDHPCFDHPSICDEFLDFIGDAPLIAHNAAFDRGFVNHELGRVGRRALPESRWTCTLLMAQKRFPGAYNSLDALCKRYKISLAEREKHGALVDTKLLALVYLELHGGRERALELTPTDAGGRPIAVELPHYGARPRPLAQRSTEAERAAHAAFVAKFLPGRSLWAQLVGAAD